MGPFEFLGRYLVLAMDKINLSLFGGSFALSVAIFTAFLKLVTLPADIKQRKSSAKMAEHQPELEKIKKRYESNPELMNKKTMEYQKKHGLGMMSGCLPLLVTMLFFMVFLRGMNFWGDYQTAQLYLKPTYAQAQEDQDAQRKEIFETFKWGWVKNIWMPDSGLAPVVMDFEQFQKIRFDKLDLLLSSEEISTLQNVTEQEYITAMAPLADQYPNQTNGWFIMPLLTGLTSMLAQWLTTKFNPSQQMQQGGMGKSMMFVMAGISVWVCITSNTAFALYWLVSNIVALVVTLLLNRHKWMKRDKKKEAAAA